MFVTESLTPSGPPDAAEQAACRSRQVRAEHSPRAPYHALLLAVEMRRPLGGRNISFWFEQGGHMLVKTFLEAESV